MSAPQIRKIDAKYHNDLAASLVPSRGRILSNDDIVVAFATFRGLDKRVARSKVQAKDHCENKKNKGACLCAETEMAILEWIDENRYRVLGDPPSTQS